MNEALKGKAVRDILDFSWETCKIYEEHIRSTRGSKVSEDSIAALTVEITSIATTYVAALEHVFPSGYDTITDLAIRHIRTYIMNVFY